jgi:O-antigen/teichoic acid export membrane protein
MLIPLIGFTACYILAATPSTASNVAVHSFVQHPILALLIGISCVSFGLTEFTRSVYRGMQQFSQITALTLISSLFQLAFITVLALYFDTAGALWGYIIGAWILIAFALRVLHFGGQLDEELKKRIQRYARFRWAAELTAIFVWSRIEIFFLQTWWGSEQVGLFSVGLTVVGLAAAGPQLLTWGILPHFSEKFGLGDVEQAKTAFSSVVRVMALMTFPACLGLTAILPELLPALFGDQFAAAVPAAMSMVTTAALIGPGTVATTIAWAVERSDVEFYAGIVGVLVAILGGLVIIPVYGIVGAAVSRAATQVAVMSAINWYLGKRMGYELPLFDVCRILAASIICGCCARLCLVLLPGISGVPVAIIVGAASYALAIRIFRGVRPEDTLLLSRAFSTLPMPLASASSYALRFIGGA